MGDNFRLASESLRESLKGFLYLGRDAGGGFAGIGQIPARTRQEERCEMLFLDLLGGGTISAWVGAILALPLSLEVDPMGPVSGPSHPDYV